MVRAAVANNCHRSTVRIGLLSARKLAFIIPRTRQGAGSIFVSSVSGQRAARLDLDSLVEFIEKIPKVNANKIGVTGMCRGGRKRALKAGPRPSR